MPHYERIVLSSNTTETWDISEDSGGITELDEEGWQIWPGMTFGVAKRKFEKDSTDPKIEPCPKVWKSSGLPNTSVSDVELITISDDEHREEANITPGPIQSSNVFTGKINNVRREFWATATTEAVPNNTLEKVRGLSNQNQVLAVKLPNSIVDAAWDLLDPNPDIHALFSKFNTDYFGGKLKGVQLHWSARMTKAAGLCNFTKTMGLATTRIKLSTPLLKFRPRKDLVQTLLHEMIHAYLFNLPSRGILHDRNGHGPDFLEHMHRINKATGASISVGYIWEICDLKSCGLVRDLKVYHNYIDEVEHYKAHWWQCSGSCRLRPPFYGLIKKSRNLAPGPNDYWWVSHQADCSGTFLKVKEPPTNLRKPTQASATVTS